MRPHALCRVAGELASRFEGSPPSGRFRRFFELGVTCFAMVSKPDEPYHIEIGKVEDDVYFRAYLRRLVSSAYLDFERNAFYRLAASFCGLSCVEPIQPWFWLLACR